MEKSEYEMSKVRKYKYKRTDGNGNTAERKASWNYMVADDRLVVVSHQMDFLYVACFDR